MELRLNVGCGPLRIPGEIGVDAYPTEACDVRADLRALPFPDGAAAFVRLDHVIEHQPFRQAVSVLREMRRVLRPGGRIRVGVPDLAATCRLYLEADGDGDLYGKALLLRNLFGSQAHEGEHHKSGWDPATLADVLAAAGFDEVLVAEDLERDEGACIFAEAVRP